MVNEEKVQSHYIYFCLSKEMQVKCNKDMQLFLDEEHKL